jgi:hypothetical protein
MAFIPPTTAATTGALAAHQKQLEQEEEETMNRYLDDKLDSYEFKIIRSMNKDFAKPATMQLVIEEEKRAGWDLLEKLDDNRLRFIRQKRARSRDAMLLSEGIDPYRAHYGISEARLVMTILGVVFGVIALGLVIAFVFFG